MEFTFKIVHVDGIKNILPDHLSRLYPNPVRSAISLKTTPDSLTVPVSMGLRLIPESTELLISPPEDQRHKLLENAHAFAHDGEAAMVQRVKESGFVWPSLKKDAYDLVQSCSSCQRFSVAKAGFHPLFTRHG